jgi:hypothetical protein
MAYFKMGLDLQAAMCELAHAVHGHRDDCSIRATFFFGPREKVRAKAAVFRIHDRGADATREA